MIEPMSENRKTSTSSGKSRSNYPMSENVKRGRGPRLSPAPMEFPAPFSFSIKTRAITGVRQVEPLHGTFGNEPDDGYHEIDIAFVSYEVSRAIA